MLNFLKKHCLPTQTPIVNCILMNGVIMSGRSKSNINLLNYEDHIEKAFKPNSFGTKPSAVALIINSPGLFHVPGS